MKKIQAFISKNFDIILISLAALTFIGFFIIVSCSPTLIGGKTPTLYGEYKVIRVVDGDTIDVDIGGEETRVRLIGVDTPESVHPDENRNTDEGETAADGLRELLEGEKVYLEYDVAVTDKYGRTLAYVYLSDRKTMVNKLLLENGLAQVMPVQPNSKYSEDFYKLQTRARKAGAGFWAEVWS